MLIGIISLILAVIVLILAIMFNSWFYERIQDDKELYEERAEDNLDAHIPRIERNNN